MNRRFLTVLCRHDLRLGSKVFTRLRSAPTGKAATGKARRPSLATKPYPRIEKHHGDFSTSPIGAQDQVRVSITPDRLEGYLEEHVEQWAKSQQVLRRLSEFGIDAADTGPLLKAFVSAVSRQEVLTALEYNDEFTARMAYDLSQTTTANMLDQTFTRLLFEWVNHPHGQTALGELISSNTVAKMSELFQAADHSQPTAWWPEARKSRVRKIIMHVGPTNSGKTHNALRALAAARRGLYAGPLRLLAHEIWERLNKGQIVPLGVDPEEDAEPDETSNIDAADASPSIRKHGSSKYARPCNMLTGEEQRIVQEDALLSCTVEMVPLVSAWDVAVIDEIQLIADPERGGAWTAALLGLNAVEVHLCGEETAVPLVQRMLRDTGDEIIVNRYERLTPLTVAEEGLHGDLSNVKKGDCFVTFSRSKIFAAKKNIEKSTGLRCAVAYGRLPPEIRSEQAALFNRANSGYDVLVGSDAIGMGLNLKIKRIILAAVRKYDGHREVRLSDSQIKQIGGRAGRFGLLGQGDEGGGGVTTLDDADLPVVRQAMKEPFIPLRFASIHISGEKYISVMRTLPPNVPVRVVVDVFRYITKVDPCYEMQDLVKFRERIEYVDGLSDRLTIQERILMQLAPVPVRDPLAVEAIRTILSLYRVKLAVKLHEALQASGLSESYRNVKQRLKRVETVSKKTSLSEMLNVLETVHKILVMYLWLSYRQLVAFPDQEEAFAMRSEAEEEMDKCLTALTMVSTDHPADSSEKMSYFTKQEILRRRTEKRETHLTQPKSTSIERRGPPHAKPQSAS